MRFHNRIKDYLRVGSIGLLTGILAFFAVRQQQYDLWTVSSLATMYGFWIVASCILIWRSSSHIAAGLHVIVYLFVTTLSFYGVPFIAGLLFPQFSDFSFPVSTFLYKSLTILVCGIVSVVLYCWNHKKWFNAILLAVPIGILTAETLHVLSILQTQQTHLLQLLFNAGFCLYLGLQFRKMAYNKELFTVSIIAVAWLTNCYIL